MRSLRERSSGQAFSPRGSRSRCRSAPCRRDCSRSPSRPPWSVSGRGELLPRRLLVERDRDDGAAAPAVPEGRTAAQRVLDQFFDVPAAEVGPPPIRPNLELPVEPDLCDGFAHAWSVRLECAPTEDPAAVGLSGPLPARGLCSPPAPDDLPSA